MSDIANPAVIIGLGGTGKWVLTYVKKNLLDTFGQVPDTVKLISFDTTKEGNSDRQEEDARVGDIQLDRGEFIYLGGNIYDICRAIRDRNEYPYIGSWLQAETYLSISSPEAFDIAKGAGQKRQFGRMALFYDLQNQYQAEVTQRITQAITDVISANKRRVPVEIYVVASLVGGTGAGMVLDVAHLARWFAEKHIKTGFAVRGFIALHTTFSAVLNTSHVMANTFASMRELDRFMAVFDRDYPIVYNPSSPELNTIYGGQLGKLFDNCYLMDASRERLPLQGVSPQHGVFPAIADTIATLLDGSTGNAYEQHYKNVNTRLGETQAQLGEPMYSSLGIFTFILPVGDIIETLSHRFALEFVGQRLLHLSESTGGRYILGYEGDPKREAESFFRQPTSSSGLTNTNFIQQVPIILELRGRLHEDRFIKRMAEQDRDEMLVWLQPSEEDPTVAQTSRSIRSILEIRLVDKVPPGNVVKDDPLSAATRISRGVIEFRERYLGRVLDGRRVGGEYREGLDKYQSIHIDRFGSFLEEKILALLNGPAPTSVDHQEAKRGKLGFVQEMLRYIIEYLQIQAELITRLQEYRADKHYLVDAREEAALAKQEMEELKFKSGFLDRLASILPLPLISKAIKAQQGYITAEQNAIDRETHELLFEYAMSITQSLRKIAEQYKVAIDNWASTLALGFIGEPGLCQVLQKSWERHEAHRAEKKRVLVHKYVTDADFENRLYQHYAEGKYGEVMARLLWGVKKIEGQPVQLTLIPYKSAGDPSDKNLRSVARQNYDVALGMAREIFSPLRDQISIADRLPELYEPATMAKRLLDNASPMIRYNAMQQGRQEVHNFVCVNEGNQIAYFDEMEDALKRMAPQAKDNQVLRAANRHSCTILSTVDVISSLGLLPYTDCEREYKQHRGDRRLLHVYPAEVNAVHYEQRLPEIGESVRMFTPLLTTMLENPRQVERFVLAYVYGLIRAEADEDESLSNRYYLELNKLHERDRLYRFRLTKAAQKPSLFQAMETFVFDQADIDNPTLRIEDKRLRDSIRTRELVLASDQDGALDLTCRIEILEKAIDTVVRDLRYGGDSIERDLGCLMELMLEDTIAGTRLRLGKR